MPATGIVVLGVRRNGAGAQILALLVAAVLLFYGVGTGHEAMPLTVAWLYAAYVILKVTQFTIRNPSPSTPGAIIFEIVYLVVAITLTVGTAIVLNRRRADLRARGRFYIRQAGRCWPGRGVEEERRRGRDDSNRRLSRSAPASLDRFWHTR